MATRTRTIGGARRRAPPAPGRADGPAAERPAERWIRRLQRLYGNQAVQRLLAQPALARAVGSAAIQRASVETAYGTWTADPYETWQGRAGGGAGEEEDRRGCAMTLRFEPGERVDATKI